jgi:hypothetical protein
LLDRPSEHAAIRAALQADGRGVVVMGAAGVGKTTLARMVTDSLATDVHWAACTESSQSIPLGAFAEWVGQDSARDPIAMLASAREALFAGGEAIVGVGDAAAPHRLGRGRAHRGHRAQRRAHSGCRDLAVEGRLFAPPGAASAE